MTSANFRHKFLHEAYLICQKRLYYTSPLTPGYEQMGEDVADFFDEIMNRMRPVVRISTALTLVIDLSWNEALVRAYNPW